MAKEMILVVDDNALNLKLVKLLLENKGYLVKTAGDGLEALKILEHVQPQLILLDLQLPGIDGLETARRIKSNPATSNILIVALTAYAMKGDEEKARAGGCDGYITKPISTAQFPLQIRSYLDGAAATSVSE